jgi:hypothetical protein
MMHVNAFCSKFEQKAILKYNLEIFVTKCTWNPNNVSINQNNFFRISIWLRFSTNVQYTIYIFLQMVKLFKQRTTPAIYWYNCTSFSIAGKFVNGN